MENVRIKLKVDFKKENKVLETLQSEFKLSGSKANSKTLSLSSNSSELFSKWLNGGENYIDLRFAISHFSFFCLRPIKNNKNNWDNRN